MSTTLLSSSFFLEVSFDVRFSETAEGSDVTRGTNYNFTYCLSLVCSKNGII